MFAFLRSNLYPASVSQNLELRSRIDELQSLMRSNAVKIRTNTKCGKRPLSDLETTAGDAANIASLTEILLKEMRFCRRTISFIVCVTTKFYDDAFDNADKTARDLESQRGEEVEEVKEVEVTSEQNHSTRLLASANDLHCRFVTLCATLGIRETRDLDKCDAATDSALFSAIHASSHGPRLDTTLSISTHFETLCGISHAAWQMMSVLAFSNLYRYHYEFQKGPTTRVDLNPSDSVFTTK